MSIESDVVPAGLRQTSTVAERDPSPTAEPEATEASPRADAPAASTGGSRRMAELRFAGSIIALVLGIKLLVYTFGVIVSRAVGDRAFNTWSDRFTMWNAWDAPHYLSIAEQGYQTTGDAANFIAFFPGYPFTVRFFDYLVPGDMLVAAFVVAGVFSIAAALLLGYLVRHDSDGDQAQATRAVWFLLIFPTAYFLHIPYTESMFLALVLGSFYAARTGHWAVAGILGALAALTRLNGIILLPALAVEAYLQYRKTGRIDKTWAWISIIPSGLLLYLWINQHYFGDPFHFQVVQAEHWFKEFQNPIASVSGMIDRIPGSSPVDRQMLVIQELLFLAIGLTASLLAFWLSRPSYGVWALLNVFLFASTSWIQSSPRYVITIFPIFILLAKIDKQTWLSMLASAWSLLMMAWFLTLFAMGRWAF